MDITPSIEVQAYLDGQKQLQGHIDKLTEERTQNYFKLCKEDCPIKIGDTVATYDNPNVMMKVYEIHFSERTHTNKYGYIPLWRYKGGKISSDGEVSELYDSTAYAECTVPYHKPMHREE